MAVKGTITRSDVLNGTIPGNAHSEIVALTVTLKLGLAHLLLEAGKSEKEAARVAIEAKVAKTLLIVPSRHQSDVVLALLVSMRLHATNGAKAANVRKATLVPFGTAQSACFTRRACVHLGVAHLLIAKSLVANQLRLQN